MERTVVRVPSAIDVSTTAATEPAIEQLLVLLRKLGPPSVAGRRRQTAAAPPPAASYPTRPASVGRGRSARASYDDADDGPRLRCLREAPLEGE